MSKENKPYVGVITFHAAYNVGSALQAYATQQILDRLGFDNEIIDYRTRSQTLFYRKLLTLEFGKNEFFYRLLRMPEKKLLLKRAQKFDSFLEEHLRVSKRSYSNYEELHSANTQYSVLFSGSDQVWNENCVEFRSESADSIRAYFLDFQELPGKKVSYASSIGTMTDEQLQKYFTCLNTFDSIAVREKSAALRLEAMLGRPVYNVLDPTLLLNSNDYSRLGMYRPDVGQRYLLFYTLANYKKLLRWTGFLEQYAEKLGMPVICLSPLKKVFSKNMRMLTDAGPIDFLSYLQNAELVVTDSFHATAFSVNFGVPVFALSDSKDRRKTELLERFGLEGRIIGEMQELENIDDYSCNYDKAQEELKIQRQSSISYLEKAISGD